jgi:hypothetical protein
MKVFVTACAVFGAIADLAYAEGTDTPRIDQRQAEQQQRIDQWVASGQLTERKANRLNKQ